MSNDKNKQMKLTETPNFLAGIEILKKYEPSPEINYMGDNEWYIGDMNYWENSITRQEIKTMKTLGFNWYEEAECFLFKPC